MESPWQSLYLPPCQVLSRIVLHVLSHSLLSSSYISVYLKHEQRNRSDLNYIGKKVTWHGKNTIYLNSTQVNRIETLYIVEFVTWTMN